MIGNPVVIIRSFAFFTFCMLSAVVVNADDSADAKMLESKLGAFQYFKPNLSLPLAGRVQTMPADSLKSIIAFDRSNGIKNTDYKPRTVLPADIALFAEYVKLLPEKYKATLSEKLMAVHFVDNFSGAGLTDWFVDEKGEMYYYMILNSALLTESLDDWLTYKENSFFAQDPVSFIVQVHTGTKYKSLLYALLHEGGHILDYEYRINPYLDPLHKKAIGNAKEVSDFTKGVWKKQKTPLKEYDIENRERLNIYGIFKDKKPISPARLPYMFSQLIDTPFVGFYASTAWHEDFADLITYYHIEKKLGGSIVVELLENGGVVNSYFPVRKLNGARQDVIESIYN